MRTRRIAIALAAACCFASVALSQVQESFPSYHPEYPPPQGWPGPVFELSQDYPTQAPPLENPPWSGIDFQERPMEYLQVVLDYSLQGNVEVDFRGQDNQVRKWYHAPFMETGCAGREFTHGLTRERRSRPGELHPKQTSWAENWAVGMYNPAGGLVVGKFWGGPGPSPVPTGANFPVGTVSLKLLFTAADPQQVPFLQNSYTWQANVYDNSRETNPCRTDWGPGDRPRVMRDVRLLQVDVAVRDHRATDTGWVFGTFVYSAAAPGKTPFERLVPVGASWADDSRESSRINQEGAFINARLRKSALNSQLVPPASGDWGNRAHVTHFGLGGRLNGPVDNAISSCISCHGRAAVPGIPTVPRGISKPPDYTPALFAEFFKTIPQGPIRGPGNRYIHTDYSLQLAFGAQNWVNCRQDNRREGCPKSEGELEVLRLPGDLPMEPGVPITRDEGE